jgi:hypothetical protein
MSDLHLPERAMKLTSHLRQRNTNPQASPPPPAADPGRVRAAEPSRVAEPSTGERVYVVQRVGAVLVGLALLVFGLLGFTGGMAFISTHGEHILGMSSNGLLSALSVVVAGVLIGAALLGPRIASTVMIVLGTLFLLSALGNMAVLRTSLNILAFEMSNVIFSVVVGLLLLVLGSYGRVSGRLPPDSPYAHERPRSTEPPESYPSTPEEFAAETAMREAEIAVVEHYATAEQHRRVQAMRPAHTRVERRRIWMEFDRPSSG